MKIIQSFLYLNVTITINLSRVQGAKITKDSLKDQRLLSILDKWCEQILTPNIDELEHSNNYRVEV
jgi:hypothetical protein